ncbi:MAG: hypothetical protein RL653_4149 [Pseudomonadota bacterium]|jgi:4-alpha-glucanotransferase
MVLPLLPTAPGDSSPYSTRSAFGLNPLFLDLHALPEFQQAGGEAALPASERDQLAQARAAKSVRYELVFPLKGAALRRAFAAFEAAGRDTPRARAFDAWATGQGEWLDNFALFTALSEAHDRRAWWEWPAPLRDREPAALALARAERAYEVRFHAWLQWLCAEQWNAVRAHARAAGVLLCGDEPFIIGQDSADCWAHPALLRRDARLGVPPDDFSATGQDWGLPFFDFDALAAEGNAWLRARAAHAAATYDVRRIDHAVGYFRQYIRDAATPTGRFVPSEEPSQRALGERNFRLFSEGAGIVAEDLGVIPPFVREVLAALGLPGYRVMRWERDGGTYRDPRAYPATSLATTGTHDTETLAEWWEAESDATRAAVAAAYPEFATLQPPDAAFTPRVHEALVAAALQSSSALCVLPWQDVFARRERVNLPGSMGDSNWSYRVEWNVEDLAQQPEAVSRAAWLAGLARAAGR